MTVHVRRRQLRSRNLRFYKQKTIIYVLSLRSVERWLVTHNQRHILSKGYTSQQRIMHYFYGWSDTIFITVIYYGIINDRWNKDMHHNITKQVGELFCIPMTSRFSGHCGRNHSPRKDMSLHLDTWFRAYQQILIL